MIHWLRHQELKIAWLLKLEGFRLVKEALNTFTSCSLEHSENFIEIFLKDSENLIFGSKQAWTLK